MSNQQQELEQPRRTVSEFHYPWALKVRTSMLHPWVTFREFSTLEEGVKVYRANSKGQKTNGLVKLIAK